MNYYFVYAKPKGSKQFRPIDYKAGRMVINLIFATMFPEFEIDEAVSHLTEMNPDTVFEKRKAG